MQSFALKNQSCLSQAVLILLSSVMKRKRRNLEQKKLAELHRIVVESMDFFDWKLSF